MIEEIFHVTSDKNYFENSCLLKKIAKLIFAICYFQKKFWINFCIYKYLKKKF